MTTVIVLDAAGFDFLTAEHGRQLRTLLEHSARHGIEVRCAAVTLAEVCRGNARTRKAEAALARSHGGQRIRVIPTDERLAKLVGMILHQGGHGSERLADAHVVALCSTADAALVLTEDPGDIAELTPAVPGCRIVTRRPDTPF